MSDHLHQYRWFSNIKWGPYYDPKSQAHFCGATDVDTLCVTYGPIDLQSLQIKFGDGWRWVIEVPVHLGGISRHWHGERT